MSPIAYQSESWTSDQTCESDSVILTLTLIAILIVILNVHACVVVQANENARGAHA